MTPTFDPRIEPALRHLVSAFLSENAKLNLSAFRTEEQCWPGNVLDSLALLGVADRFGIADGSRAIDVGTGGGFPLLPLAICLPTVGFTGLDSTRKKIDAVRRIVEATGIANVNGLIAERAEVVGRDPAERERYDLVTARALGALPVLLEYCSPFAKVGGRIVIWKSLHIDEELASAGDALRELACEAEPPFRYDLGGDWGERQLLIYRKIGPTPDEYPRAVGQASKRPL